MKFSKQLIILGMSFHVVYAPPVFDYKVEAREPKVDLSFVEFSKMQKAENQIKAIQNEFERLRQQKLAYPADTLIDQKLIQNQKKLLDQQQTIVDIKLNASQRSPNQEARNFFQEQKNQLELRKNEWRDNAVNNLITPYEPSSVSPGSVAVEIRSQVFGPRTEQSQSVSLAFIDLLFNDISKVDLKNRLAELKAKKNLMQQAVEQADRYQIDDASLKKALYERDMAQLNLLTELIKGFDQSGVEFSQAEVERIQKASEALQRAQNSVNKFSEINALLQSNFKARFGYVFDIIQSKVESVSGLSNFPIDHIQTILKQLSRSQIDTQQLATNMSVVINELSHLSKNEPTGFDKSKQAFEVTNKLFALINEGQKFLVAQEASGRFWLNRKFWELVAQISVFLGIVSSITTIVRFVVDGEIFKTLHLIEDIIDDVKKISFR